MPSFIILGCETFPLLQILCFSPPSTIPCIFPSVPLKSWCSILSHSNSFPISYQIHKILYILTVRWFFRRKRSFHSNATDCLGPSGSCPGNAVPSCQRVVSHIHCHVAVRQPPSAASYNYGNINHLELTNVLHFCMEEPGNNPQTTIYLRYLKLFLISLSKKDEKAYFWLE